MLALLLNASIGLFKRARRGPGSDHVPWSLDGHQFVALWLSDSRVQGLRMSRVVHGTAFCHRPRSEVACDGQGMS